MEDDGDDPIDLTLKLEGVTMTGPVIRVRFVVSWFDLMVPLEIEVREEVLSLDHAVKLARTELQEFAEQLRLAAEQTALGEPTVR